MHEWQDDWKNATMNYEMKIRITGRLNQGMPEWVHMNDYINEWNMHDTMQKDVNGRMKYWKDEGVACINK